jgi:NADH:ubiquinone oxidoreductase subunit 6 (subunit J)
MRARKSETKGSRVAVMLGIPGMLTGERCSSAWVCSAAFRNGIRPIGALPGSPKDIAQLLFHDFLLPFEVTSVSDFDRHHGRRGAGQQAPEATGRKAD